AIIPLLLKAAENCCKSHSQTLDKCIPTSSYEDNALTLQRTRLKSCVAAKVGVAGIDASGRDLLQSNAIGARVQSVDTNMLSN
ncbi:hypothetical protein Tco_0688946, partial [Tanacetum coccineum]